MPVYEYYCPTCSTKFEKLVSLRAAEKPVACAAGHANIRKLISVFAVGNHSGAGDEPMPFASGGGCACGGACSCGGH